jgi:gas vesicle protein
MQHHLSKGGNLTMKEDFEERKNSLFTPFLLGGLVGAGIALLLAPKSGKEVRNDIKEYAARAKNTLVTAVDEGKKIYEDGKTAVVSAVEAGKSAYQQEKERHQRAA